MEFEIPDLMRNRYRKTFIRMGNKIYIGPTNRTHEYTARQDRILKQVQGLLSEGSQEADSGFMQVNNITHVVSIYDNSLSLPVDHIVREDVRRGTGIVVAQLFPPSYEVTATVPDVRAITVYQDRGKRTF